VKLLSALVCPGLAKMNGWASNVGAQHTVTPHTTLHCTELAPSGVSQSLRNAQDLKTHQRQ
jgi:hypothetical protein